MIGFDGKKNFEVLGLGEVMLRLSPVGKERVSYCETFEKMAGGSELNVVAGISMLGMRTGMITKLPRNDIGKFIKHKIRYTGTSDDYIIYDDSEEYGYTKGGIGIGLKNIYRRLQYYYGEEAELKIESIHAEGTKVVLSLPKKMQM